MKEIVKESIRLFKARNLKGNAKMVYLMVSRDVKKRTLLLEQNARYHRLSNMWVFRDGSELKGGF